MANITPAPGQVLVRYLEDATEDTESVQLVGGSEPINKDVVSESEHELSQVEIMTGKNAGQIGLVSEWNLSDLVPGTMDMYFAQESAILGYSDAPLTEVVSVVEEEASAS